MHFFFEKKDTENRRLIERIITEQYNRYYRLAYSYAHNEADAYDIVQTGAYKAIRSSHSLRNPEYADTWIYRIMLNECFRYLKQPKNISYEEMQEEHAFDAGYTEDTYSNIDLQKALDALPEKDKAVIILKYFEEKTFEEMSAILGENSNTLKSRLYRSIRKLRESISDES